MSLVWLLFAMQAATQAPPPLWGQVTESLERSGRVVELVETRAERLQAPRLAPGAPPLLSFRYFEGKGRHRFGELGLVMDDAGH